MSSTGAGSSTSESSALSGRPVLESWRDVPERAVDWALGVSAGGWALATLNTDRDLAVRLALAALHLTVAILFLGRFPAQGRGSLPTLIAALPSAAFAGASIHAAGSSWPPHSQGLFALGATLAIVSLTTLGKSFTIFPARRPIVTRGPYRFVRHPAYVAELTMVVGAASAEAELGFLHLLAVLTVGFAMLRIHAEETLLEADPEFRSYRAKVRYRLLPGIW